LSGVFVEELGEGAGVFDADGGFFAEGDEDVAGAGGGVGVFGGGTGGVAGVHLGGGVGADLHEITTGGGVSLGRDLREGVDVLHDVGCSVSVAEPEVFPGDGKFSF
jgi:hypothetical protein